jgi:hypothetical protein
MTILIWLKKRYWKERNGIENNKVVKWIIESCRAEWQTNYTIDSFD